MEKITVFILLLLPRLREIKFFILSRILSLRSMKKKQSEKLLSTKDFLSEKLFKESLATPIWIHNLSDLSMLRLLAWKLGHMESKISGIFMWLSSIQLRQTQKIHILLTISLFLKNKRSSNSRRWFFFCILSNLEFFLSKQFPRTLLLIISITNLTPKGFNLNSSLFSFFSMLYWDATKFSKELTMFFILWASLILSGIFSGSIIRPVAVNLAVDLLKSSVLMIISRNSIWGDARNLISWINIRKCSTVKWGQFLFIKNFHSFILNFFTKLILKRK